MEFAKAKDELRKQLLSQGLALVSEDEKSITFSQGEDFHSFRVDEKLISDYAEIAEDISKYNVGPEDTSILGPGYREQRIIPAERFFSPLSETTFILGDPSSEKPYVEVGTATAIYRNIFRTSPLTLPWLLSHAARNKYFNLERRTAKLPTIRVFNLPQLSEAELIRRSDDIFESALFELSYATGRSFERATSWPSPVTTAPEDLEKDEVNLVDLPLKNVIYNKDVIRFYRRGIGAFDPFIQFLSYYHVAEYFFIPITDSILYKRMSSLINDPAFSTAPRNLDNVIRAVIENRKETDEVDMLKSVLMEHVDEDDLIRQIADIENLRGPIYTVKGRIFGYELDKINLQKGHIFGPLSKRIKTIRNCLVHSSDRRERRDRYLPGPAADKALSRELPLIKYLAERVIIGSAQPGTL